MRKAELPGLTGIRIYAAMFVFLSHVVILPGMESLAGKSLIFDAGVVAVSFFFVLSGFIVTYNYADSFRDGVSASTYKEFVLDRFARIYPVHILSLVIVAPIAILSPNFPLDWRALPLHLTLLQCWWPSSTPAFHQYFNVPSWALSCEWFFYVVAPMAIYLVFGNNRRWVLPAAAVTVAYGCGLWWLSTSSEDSVRLHFVSWFAPSRLVEFMAGVLLAQLFIKGSRDTLAEFSVLAQVAGISMIIAGAMYRAHAPWPFWGGLLYVPGSAMLILGLAGGGGFVVRHLNQPWVKRLGGTSFAFYMIHGPLLRWTKNVFFYLGWEVKSWPSFWGVCITLFMLILLGSLIVNSLFEAPIHRRLRTLIRAKGLGEQRMCGQKAQEGSRASPIVRN